MSKKEIRNFITEILKNEGVTIKTIGEIEKSAENRYHFWRVKFVEGGASKFRFYVNLDNNTIEITEYNNTEFLHIVNF